jgi:hypothetical protein
MICSKFASLITSHENSKFFVSMVKTKANKILTKKVKINKNAFRKKMKNSEVKDFIREENTYFHDND